MHYDVAVDFVHTGCFPDQLNLGSRLISTAELYQRAFLLSSIENERNTFDRLLVILRPFLQREDTKKKLYQTRKFFQLEFIAYRTENHLKAPVLL